MQVRMLISTEILAQSDCGEPQPALMSRPRARELPAPTTPLRPIQLHQWPSESLPGHRTGRVCSPPWRPGSHNPRRDELHPFYTLFVHGRMCMCWAQLSEVLSLNFVAG